MSFKCICINCIILLLALNSCDQTQSDGVVIQETDRLIISHPKRLFHSQKSSTLLFLSGNQLYRVDLGTGDIAGFVDLAELDRDSIRAAAYPELPFVETDNLTEQLQLPGWRVGAYTQLSVSRTGDIHLLSEVIWPIKQPGHVSIEFLPIALSFSSDFRLLTATGFEPIVSHDSTHISVAHGFLAEDNAVFTNNFSTTAPGASKVVRYRLIDEKYVPDVSSAWLDGRAVCVQKCGDKLIVGLTGGMLLTLNRDLATEAAHELNHQKIIDIFPTAQGIHILHQDLSNHEVFVSTFNDSLKPLHSEKISVADQIACSLGPDHSCYTLSVDKQENYVIRQLRTTAESKDQ